MSKLKLRIKNRRERKRISRVIDRLLPDYFWKIIPQSEGKLDIKIVNGCKKDVGVYKVNDIKRVKKDIVNVGANKNLDMINRIYHELRETRIPLDVTERYITTLY